MGVVSVVSNLVPADVKALVATALKGDYAKARQIHNKLVPLIKAVFIESSPGPVKTALAIQGKCTRELRLPMCDIDPATEEKLKATMKAYGLSISAPAAKETAKAGKKK